MTLPRVSIWSQFRDSAGQQIELYRKQIKQLDYPPELIRVYACEGDSVDETLVELRVWATEDERVTVVHYDTGIEREHHTTRPRRMQAVAINGNKGWDAIAWRAWGDLAWMIESDLLISSDLLRTMVERMPDEADIFAPMVWIDVGNRYRFYDVWAYRQNEKMFLPFPPAWYASRYQDEPFELDSVGSCVLFRMAPILEGLRLSEESCVLGMCNEARRRGYRVFCDPTIDIIHPKIEGVA